jgi:hypothetical protein
VNARGRFLFLDKKLIREHLKMSKTKRFLLLMLASLCLAVPGMAQSTIFNIPTTDAVAKGSVYFEFDYLSQVPPADGARSQVFAPRFIAGLGGNVEAGVNVFAYHTPGSTNSYFQPNIKWKFYSTDTGLATAVGAILYTPINNRDGVDTYGLVYGNFSKKVQGTYGPRITFGPYGIVGAEENYFGTKAGAIVGFEQPVHAKASIVADWFSGVSGFGYFTPGVSFTLPHSGLLNIGYSIGNDSYDRDDDYKNRYFFIYYGVTF